MLQKRIVRALTNSDFRAHTAPLFTQLCFPITTVYFPQLFTTYSLPVTKYTATVLEVQTHIDPIYVKQILSSLQFFFKVPKSGIPCQMIFQKQRL